MNEDIKQTEEYLQGVENKEALVVIQAWYDDGYGSVAEEITEDNMSQKPCCLGDAVDDKTFRITIGRP